jgi:hypothetical protein
MPSVTVIVGRERISIPTLSSGSAPLVPSQQVLVELEGSLLPSEILINDEPHPVVLTPDASRGHVLLDRYRSTGFHCVQLGAEYYCFGTVDAKLQLDGILELLKVIGREGLSWGNQLMFSDGVAIRDVRIDYAWLRRAGRRVVSACSDIAARPLTQQAATVHFGRATGGRLKRAETIAKLRADPRTLLEEHPRGVVQLGNKRFMPRRVCTERLSISADTPANRRATKLLLGTLHLLWSLKTDTDLPKRPRIWLKLVEDQVSSLLDNYPFNSLLRVCHRVADRPSGPELADQRYRETYALYDDLHNLLGWTPSQKVADRFSYIGYSDEIYQAFVAVLLGAAFGTRTTRPYLKGDLAEPSFSGSGWDIYYDTKPPTPGYMSWRDHSSRPANLTPDYTIIDTLGGRGLLADAKYRGNAGGGRLPSTSLCECQVYMQHFGLKNFAVFYPGKERFMAEVKGDGFTILEVSITPFAGVAEWVRAEVRPALETLLEPLKQP